MEISVRTLSILYVNHRGQVAWRTVTPVMGTIVPEVNFMNGDTIGLRVNNSVVFTSTPHHQNKQWVMEVYDHDRKEPRTYAMSGIYCVRPYTPEPDEYESAILALLENTIKTFIRLINLPDYSDLPTPEPEEQAKTTEDPEEVEEPKVMDTRPPLVISVYREPGSPNWFFTQGAIERANKRLYRDKSRLTEFQLRERNGDLKYLYLYNEDTSCLVEEQPPDGQGNTWYMLKADELYQGCVEGITRVPSASSSFRRDKPSIT